MDRVTKLWGDGFHWVQDKGSHPHEAMLLSLDCSKAMKALGWKPRLKLEGALDWTVAWYKDFLARADARRLSLDQIARYEATT
jgi:CDP-glucose 4,6-dehydratase